MKNLTFQPLQNEMLQQSTPITFVNRRTGPSGRVAYGIKCCSRQIGNKVF